MTSPFSSVRYSDAYPPNHVPPAYGNSFDDASVRRCASALSRRISSFISSVQNTFNGRESSGRYSSDFFTCIYNRLVTTVNYARLHINQILPEYLTKAGASSIGGFIIGVLTPVGPLWGTVTGLLLATGWQLCIEYHTDRSSSPEPQFHD